MLDVAANPDQLLTAESRLIEHASSCAMTDADAVDSPEAHG
jgi:hypothetical protein